MTYAYGGELGRRIASSLETALKYKYEPRKFGDKTYYLYSSYSNKSSAESVVDNIKPFGVNARIVKSNVGYKVFIRRK